MQVILDSSFARPGSAPIWGGKKGKFRDWTSFFHVLYFDKTWRFGQSERVQGPIYVIKRYKTKQNHSCRDSNKGLYDSV